MDGGRSALHLRRDEELLRRGIEEERLCVVRAVRIHDRHLLRRRGEGGRADLRLDDAVDGDLLANETVVADIAEVEEGAPR